METLISKSAVEIAQLVGGRLKGECPRQLHGVASLSEATESDVAFLGNPKYHDQVASSRAGVVLIPYDFDVAVPAGRAWIECQDPSAAFTNVILAFTPPPIEYAPGIHPTAVIAEDVEVPASCHIGAGVVIESGAVVGEGTVMLPNCYIGHKSTVGAKCLFYPNVVVRERCIIGNGVILHPGVVIGADGFGYKSGPNGHEKIPQVGIVQIDDGVEIGANSAVDRARFGRTWVQAGTKIDNLVQVGHNVEIGQACILVAQAGVAGSTHIGNGVIIAGQAGISGHLRIGDGTIIMAQAGISKDTAPGAILIGSPAVDRRAFAKEKMLLKHLEAMNQQMKDLSAQIASLKEQLADKGDASIKE